MQPSQIPVFLGVGERSFDHFTTTLPLRLPFGGLLVRSSAVRDYAELARLGQVSRGRLGYGF
jgi:hypothetical protein